MGTLSYPNSKICYRGQWKNNKFNGFGVLNSSNPVKDLSLPALNYKDFNQNETHNWIQYEGEFKDSRFHG